MSAEVTRSNSAARSTLAPIRCVGFACLLILAACSSAPPPPREVQAPVTIAKVVRKSVPELVTAVGTVEAINSIAIKSLVDGQVLECLVKDGDDVKAGQLLFKIDPRPAQSTLAQMQAALAKDEAARDLAKAQVDRYKPVADKGFISRDQMQQYLTAYSAAAASVKVDQANVASAQLTLGYTSIYAPISGRAGRILVQPGNLVKANDTNPMLVLNQIAPIFVNFAVPGRLVDRIRNVQAQHALEVSASSEKNSPETGQLAFVDNAVDPATNTVKLRASFGNAQQRLWPGQFVNLTLVLGSDEALVVPDAAVKAGPNGNYVFIVKADGSAEQRGITVVRSTNGESIVDKGLAQGETVVTDGQSRLVDGTKVKITQAEPDSDAARASTASKN